MLLNIHAPSGTAKRVVRETLFNSDLTYLVERTRKLSGVDVICVLEAADPTRH
jgi:hypothetical protein